MSGRSRRNCPICLKENLLYLSHHLAQVHNLSSAERQPWLKSATYSPTKPTGLPFMPPYPFWGMPQYPMSMNPQLPMEVPQSRIPKPPKTAKVQPVNCLETQPYPEFKFHHTFSMLVVGPTQCGKTYFVQQLLTKNCIEYPSEKPTQIYWFYNQWQPRYDALKRALKKRIQFTQGLPDLSEDLNEINPEYNNILVFDDLMSQAIDSPVLSQLFTQGRHRNASVILLLQNMFPKGKFNTDISRNAQYMALFRSPSDRKQIDIIAERIFAKDRPNFMNVYGSVSAKPYGYILVDNQPKTTSEKQVVSDVFGKCKSYPHISTQSEITQVTTDVQPLPAVKRKVEPHVPPAKKQKKPTVKRKAESDNKPAKKSKKQPKTKQTTKKDKKLPQKQTKPQTRKPRKQAVYKPQFIRESSEEDSNETEKPRDFMNELHALARWSRNGFGPRFVHE